MKRKYRPTVSNVAGNNQAQRQFKSVRPVEQHDGAKKKGNNSTRRQNPMGRGEYINDKESVTARRIKARPKATLMGTIALM